MSIGSKVVAFLIVLATLLSTESLRAQGLFRPCFTNPCCPSYYLFNDDEESYSNYGYMDYNTYPYGYEFDPYPCRRFCNYQYYDKYGNACDDFYFFRNREKYCPPGSR